MHVGYNTKPSADPWYPYGDAKSRDKLISSWQSPQTVFSNNIARDRIHAGSSKLFDFYYKLESGPRISLYVKERNFNDTWSSTYELIQNTSNPEFLVSATNSYDNKTHIVYEIFNGVGYRSYNGSWSSESEISSGYGWISPKISSVSNDLYVVWRKYDDYLYFRQYDAAPLTPSNFAGTTHNVGWNAYPKITWSTVNEPDVRENANGIKIQRSLNGASFTDLTNISGTSTSFIDYGVEYAGSGPANVSYKIQSVDLGSNTSDWTSIVQIQYGDVWKAGSNNEENFVVTEYELYQNYPNPFNPTTTIQYDVKDAGFVQLKVYDILGNEVGVLANEEKGAGSYKVNFSADNLKSGVYIYTLRVNNYFQHRKFTILK